MAFTIRAIDIIDPEALVFEGENESDVLYPVHAYEVIADLEGERIETYGVVWDIDGQMECFIAEEFEELLFKKFPAKVTDETLRSLNDLIRKRLNHEKIRFPYVIWE